MISNPTIEQWRLREGYYRSETGDGNNGIFYVPGPLGRRLQVMVSDGTDWRECGFKPPAWEHVSVSLKRHTPHWDEMCFIKNLFWAPEEMVIQIHPPASEYINDHPHCLHLWKPIGLSLPLPPSLTVGYGKRSIEAV